MNMRILVVDDDSAILDAVKDLLELEGCEVRTTGMSDEACTLAKQFHPDVIILDLHPSGRDGNEICEEIKTDAILQNIPVIMMSAHLGARKSALRAGASNFLPKPFEATHLLKTVKYAS